MPETQPNEIEAAREALRRAAEDQSFTRRRPKSKTEKIRELRVEITRLRNQGRTWQDIADALDGTLAASADTIRLAIGSISTKKRPAASARSKAPATAAPAPPAKRRAQRDPEPEPPSAPASPKKRFGPPEL